MQRECAESARRNNAGTNPPIKTAQGSRRREGRQCGVCPNGCLIGWNWRAAHSYASATIMWYGGAPREAIGNQTNKDKQCKCWLTCPRSSNSGIFIRSRIDRTILQCGQLDRFSEIHFCREREREREREGGGNLLWQYTATGYHNNIMRLKLWILYGLFEHAPCCWESATRSRERERERERGITTSERWHCIEFNASWIDSTHHSTTNANML